MELLKILYCITAYLSLFLGLAVLILKTTKKYKFWLVSFLFLIFFNCSIILGRWYFNIVPDGAFFRFFSFLLQYSSAPLFYFFVRNISNEKNELSTLKKVGFLIPFLIGLVVINLPSILWENYWFFFNQLLSLNFVIHVLLFVSQALLIYKKFQQNAENYVSQNNIEDHNFIKYIVYSFLVIMILLLLGSFVFMYFETNYTYVGSMIEFLILMFINGMFFFGLKLPASLEHVSQSGIEIEVDQSKEKYLSSTITDNQKSVIVDQLEQVMTSERYYSLPELTIRMLSEKINVQQPHLSQVINEVYEQNFCNYINSLRIEDAKKQLCDVKNKQKTILEILYDVGFNSKSVFNKVFKDQTGLTPSQYKKQNI